MQVVSLFQIIVILLVLSVLSLMITWGIDSLPANFQQCENYLCYSFTAWPFKIELTLIMNVNYFYSNSVIVLEYPCKPKFYPLNLYLVKGVMSII